MRFVIEPPMACAPTQASCPQTYPGIGRLTILNHRKNSLNDPSELALQALGWILSDDARARRFLDLTGLTPDDLRAALDQPATHRAVLDFLCAHEPDLIAAADSLGVPATELAAAGERL